MGVVNIGLEQEKFQCKINEKGSEMLRKINNNMWGG